MARNNEQGFTVIELVVVITVTLVVLTIAYTFFNTSFRQYLGLHAHGLNMGSLAVQTQRLAAVMRGVTYVTVAEPNEMRVTAYFSPDDAYVSEVRYYPDASGERLLADVTPYTSNPPDGSPDTSKTRTVTIVDTLYMQPGVAMFEYVDSSGTPMTHPIDDLHIIKGLRINMASKQPDGEVDSMSLQVSLRNRKTNL